MQLNECRKSWSQIEGWLFADLLTITAVSGWALAKHWAGLYSLILMVVALFFASGGHNLKPFTEVINVDGIMEEGIIGYNVCKLTLFLTRLIICGTSWGQVHAYIFIGRGKVRTVRVYY